MKRPKPTEPDTLIEPPPTPLPLGEAIATLAYSY